MHLQITCCTEASVGGVSRVANRSLARPQRHGRCRGLLHWRLLRADRTGRPRCWQRAICRRRWRAIARPRLCQPLLKFLALPVERCQASSPAVRTNSHSSTLLFCSYCHTVHIPYGRRKRAWRRATGCASSQQQAPHSAAGCTSSCSVEHVAQLMFGKHARATHPFAYTPAALHSRCSSL